MRVRNSEYAARSTSASLQGRPGTAVLPARLRSVFAVLILAVTGCEADGPQREPVVYDVDLPCASFAKSPVLFVHGSGLTSGSFAPMVDAFLQAGYPAAYLMAIDMVPREGDNVRAAETFISAGVKDLLAGGAAALRASACDLPAPGQVDIVAHSMGAFSSRWFARFVEPAAVRTLVSLAGANHGTDELCGRSGRGDRQMCPAFAANARESEVQVALNGTSAAPADETPFGVGRDAPGRESIPPDDHRRIAYFSIRLEPDRWITPATSAILDGAGGPTPPATDGIPVTETSPGNYRFNGQTTHDGLPTHPLLIRFVLRILG